VRKAHSKMTPILATVLKVDKQGNEYVVTVQLGNEDFSGTLEKLSFENKPDQGWCHYGWLSLVYHRDPDLRAGQKFPLWSASAT
jgi:hypothetical protein